MVFPFLGISAELMTPKLMGIPGDLAFFVHGGVEFGFSPGWSIAKEGDPGQVDIPDTPAGVPAGPPGATGTGTETRAESQLASYGAGFGVAIEFPFQGRTMRLRPSVEYRYDELGYRLRLSDAESVPGTQACPCGIAQLSTRDQESFHLLGAGLELEMDAARAGSMMLTLFASGRAYHVLNDRNHTLRLTGGYTPSVPALEPITAEADFERKRWTYQVGVGLRFRWLPQEF